MTCRLLILLAVLPLSACAGDGKPGPESAAVAPMAWQKAIRDSDRTRLAGLWSAWTRSLNEADKAGMSASVAALGPMAVPDAARPAPPPAPGEYLCRNVKLGSRDDGTSRPVAPPLSISEFGPCSIAARGGLLWFEQDRGAQRIAGTLYPDGERQVFLGAMTLAGEAGTMAYGTDGDRDQVGVLRGLGEGHWRIELPWPMWQSNLEIIEIVSAKG